ncbi:MAG: hypothetical protein ACR65R_07835 [Methylomicrobium sp.]
MTSIEHVSNRLTALIAVLKRPFFKNDASKASAYLLLLALQDEVLKTTLNDCLAESLKIFYE